MEKLKHFLSEHRIKKRFITTFLNYHRPGDKKDILILSSPRSGSTLLMELLYTQPGIKYINEPLDKSVLDHFGFLPIRTRWDYLNLDPYEQRAIKYYFQNSKEIKYFGPTDVFDKNYKFFSNRRVFKVIRANALIEWFMKELDMEIIYLIRHPIAQSLSCINRGHHCAIAEYLQDHDFSETYLNKEQKSFAQQVFESGSLLEKFVVEWCLDNLAPLYTCKTHNFLTASYEELVLKPRKVIGLLCDKLDLPDRDRMLSRIRTPSRVTDTSTMQTKDMIRKGDRNFLVSKWEKYVSESETRRAFEILHQFDIKVYRFGSYLARYDLLDFKHQKGK